MYQISVYGMAISDNDMDLIKALCLAAENAPMTYVTIYDISLRNALVDKKLIFMEPACHSRCWATGKLLEIVSSLDEDFKK